MLKKILTLYFSFFYFFNLVGATFFLIQYNIAFNPDNINSLATALLISWFLFAFGAISHFIIYENGDYECTFFNSFVIGIINTAIFILTVYCLYLFIDFIFIDFPFSLLIYSILFLCLLFFIIKFPFLNVMKKIGKISIKFNVLNKFIEKKLDIELIQLRHEI
jgi:hypothetical protein